MQVVRDNRGQVVKHEPLEPQMLELPHRTPHDFPQDIATPFVARQDAIGDEKRRRSHMVCDDARRDCLWRQCRGQLGRRGGTTAPCFYLLQQWLEYIRVVVRQRPLLDGGDALEAHARVDGGLRQRLERAVGLAVELHEHVVPDLDEPVAVARGAEAHRSGAGQIVAAEVVDLRAAAARARLAHRPEVVARAQLVDAVGRHEVLPPRIRLVVARDARLALEDRREQSVRRELPFLRQQFPGVGDRVLLEVVAEGEVPEHLEERVVAERGADVVEVVVLAADAHALLRGRRP